MTIEPYIESTQITEEGGSKKKSHIIRSASLLLIAFMAMVLPASAAINVTEMTADFTAIGDIIEASATIFTALGTLVVALVPVVVILAIAKFIPGVFDKVLGMFHFGGR